MESSRYFVACQPLALPNRVLHLPTLFASANVYLVNTAGLNVTDAYSTKLGLSNCATTASCFLSCCRYTGNIQTRIAALLVYTEYYGKTLHRVFFKRQTTLDLLLLYFLILGLFL